jgi:hypothetical protein
MYFGLWALDFGCPVHAGGIGRFDAGRRGGWSAEHILHAGWEATKGKDGGLANGVEEGFYWMSDALDGEASHIGRNAGIWKDVRKASCFPNREIREELSIEHCAEVGSKGEKVALALFPARVQILRNGGGLTATLAKASSRVFERMTAGSEEVKDGR